MMIIGWMLFLGTLTAQTTHEMPGCEKLDPTNPLTCVQCRSTNGWSNATNQSPCLCGTDYVPDLIGSPTSCQSKRYLTGCLQAPVGAPAQKCDICDHSLHFDEKNKQCGCEDGFLPQMFKEVLMSCIEHDLEKFPPECVVAHWTGPDGTRCAQCKEGYLFTDATYRVCIPYTGTTGCKFASSLSQCSKCQRWYLPDADPITKCWEFKQGALNCEFASGVNQCAQCQDDYIPSDAQITQCVQDPGVKKCIYADYKPLRCTGCEPGYYLEDGQCYSYGAVLRITTFTLLLLGCLVFN